MIIIYIILVGLVLALVVVSAITIFLPGSIFTKGPEAPSGEVYGDDTENYNDNDGPSSSDYGGFGPGI